MATERKDYTVSTTFRTAGTWHKEGETVSLTEAEYDAYAAHLEGGADAAAYLPGQEPQEPTPLDPITTAQAEAGDVLAQKQVEGRIAAYPDGSVEDEGYQTRPATAKGRSAKSKK